MPAFEPRNRAYPRIRTTNTTRHRYLIGNLQHAPDVTMTIAHTLDKPDPASYRYCTGRVTVELDYPETSGGSTTQVRKFPFDGKWFPLDQRSFEMHVGDFILPPELCCQGIGTLCWSEIRRTLPLPSSFPFFLSGGLSDKDATITGKILGTKRTIDNIARRDAFWRRMLDPASPPFMSDQNGEGSFRGLFVDPVAHSSYVPKAIATKIPTA
ncbi:hypothetical protein [Burkholderia lata]|uniref:Uncharacterized protein n=1 Tax=Burkholderia lata (strain ATCC 17760 / DSM 23089 / LMG 22485 / NCIMB 9086 / R18194 / 383) TaxID=482957 RepID=Q391E7_BURL3|nr:hypothetical protein [Burkholderia lata]ABB12919.1 hypothetical protein Bcep18194_B2808 [Burkholderia lata]